VHGILGADRRSPLAWVDQSESRFEAERLGDRRVRRQARRTAVLDGVNHRDGQAGPPGEIAESPGPALTSLRNRDPDMARHEDRDLIGPRA